MRMEFDRNTCIGMFNWVKEWERSVEDRDAGAATLVGGDEDDSDLDVSDVPDSEEFEAKMAARVCPVDAITVCEDDD